MLGYNPESNFAAELKAKPWYEVITQPGFRLGLTDPTTDPKGQLAVEALRDIADSQGVASAKTLSADPANFYPEETLVGRLQAGQLDAGFFYTSEAAAAKIPTVTLKGVRLKATYTVTILARAPHQSAAHAFLQYLLGPSGQAILKQDGFTTISPVKITGSGAPGTLLSERG